MELFAADSGKPPSEFRLFKFGENRTTQGTFILDPAGLDAVMAAYRDHGVELAIDYEHNTFKTAAAGKAPAAGWFNPEARSDGLWAANVRWTEPATRHLRDKEYRYFSPTFKHDAGRRVIALLPAALTNFPSSKNQEALVAASETARLPVMPVKENHSMSLNIPGLVGLKDDAAEAEVEGRVTSLAGLERDLLEATGAPDVGTAMAAVVSLKSIAAENASLRKDIADWQALRDREEADKKKVEFDAVMLAAFDAQKVGRKDEGEIQTLTTLFEKYGIEAVKLSLSTRRGRPQPVYQAAMSTNVEEQKLRDYNAYKAANPGVDPLEAAIASQRGSR